MAKLISFVILSFLLFGFQDEPVKVVKPVTKPVTKPVIKSVVKKEMNEIEKEFQKKFELRLKTEPKMTV